MMRNTSGAFLGAVATAFTLGFVAPTTSHAAPVSQMGDDVVFNYDDSSLFGTGFVIGNSIFFSPTDFIAESTNGEGVVPVSSVLNLQVTVKDGSDYVIDGAHLVEGGDYFRQGTGTSVGATGRLRATSLTSNPGTNNVEDFLELDGPLDTVGTLTAWSGEAHVDFDDVATWGGDTDVLFQLQNNLTATTTEDASLAQIFKKENLIGIEVMPEVPLPGAVWLFGSALLGLGGFRYQSKK